MFCGKCGFELKDGMLFCPKCGSKSVLTSEEDKKEIKSQPTSNIERPTFSATRIEAVEDENKVRLKKAAQNNYSNVENAATEAIPTSKSKELKNNKTSRKVYINAAGNEVYEINNKQNDSGGLFDDKSSTKKRGSNKKVKVIYLAFAALAVISAFSSSPEFAASDQDVLIYKTSHFFMSLIALALPGIIILSNSARDKIPFFKKRKTSATVIGWAILIFIGGLTSAGIDSLHSDEYNSLAMNYSIESGSQEAEATTDIKTQTKSEAVSTDEDENTDYTNNSSIENKEQNTAPELSTEQSYKSACIDYSYSTLTQDETKYLGVFIKKDLMVRSLGTYTPTGETIYCCGEKTGETSYVSGTFYVFDRRSDKTQPIELYDKVYIYGQVKELNHVLAWDRDSIDPYIDAKYVEFKGKFGD